MIKHIMIDEINIILQQGLQDIRFVPGSPVLHASVHAFFSLPEGHMV